MDGHGEKLDGPEGQGLKNPTVTSAMVTEGQGLKNLTVTSAMDSDGQGLKTPTVTGVQYVVAFPVFLVPPTARQPAAEQCPSIAHVRARLIQRSTYANPPAESWSAKT